MKKDNLKEIYIEWAKDNLKIMERMIEQENYNFNTLPAEQRDKNNAEIFLLGYKRALQILRVYENDN